MTSGPPEPRQVVAEIQKANERQEEAAEELKAAFADEKDWSAGGHYFSLRDGPVYMSISVSPDPGSGFTCFISAGQRTIVHQPFQDPKQALEYANSIRRELKAGT